ncbi:pleckstrin homology domain-containing family B member 2 isoform X3 [Chelonia mydas]|uniref:pleckstrin homology domain-containing family B member 2 isoform X3 n=1 Tax=Chelonia mydas TaxID=8469 RepID=UPI0018A20FD9|nr:pleckstrin homology domain-containing family B member 2 isoform X3 [Chelonia mydas]
MAFVKSGWLLRQSTILRRWKKNWFDLWSDGHLLFYDDQQRHDIEDKVHMRVHCINIRVGNECRVDFQPPEGKPRDSLLQIVCRDGKTINLCAESSDDCLAWKIALQDARTNAGYVGSEVMYDETAISSAPPPYTAYATPSPEFYCLKLTFVKQIRTLCPGFHSNSGLWLRAVQWCISTSWSSSHLCL